MTAPTHITFAEFIYLLILTTTGVALNAWNALAIAAASLLPDLDTGASTIGKLFPSISRSIERRFGHRTLTHSTLFTLLYSMALLPLAALSGDTYVCLCAGYLTHPLLDTMTIQGVALFYPFSNVKCVFPLEVNNPHRYRIQTGSKLDKTLGIFFLIGCIPTFLIAHQGYERFIRFTQKNVESAVRDYNEFSKTHTVFADIKGHNLLTKEQIAGRFEVVGTLNDRTLLFKAPDGRLHSLGGEYQSEYAAELVLCWKGEEARVAIQTIDLTNQPLAQLRDYLELYSEHRLFGVLSTSDQFALPQETKDFSPITGAGTTLKFNFASYTDIITFNLQNLFITKGLLTVRTIIPLSTTSQITAGGRSRGADTWPTYSTVVFQAEASETIQYLHKIGDSVATGELLARRNLSLIVDRQLTLNTDKVHAIAQERDATLSELHGKILQAQKQIQIDSSAAAFYNTLARQGYSTQAKAKQAEMKLQRTRENLEKLKLSAPIIRKKFDLATQKLSNDRLTLSAKDRAAQEQSEIRSSVAGIIIDIRQHYRKEKLQVTIIIRHL